MWMSNRTTSCHEYQISVAHPDCVGYHQSLTWRSRSSLNCSMLRMILSKKTSCRNHAQPCIFNVLVYEKGVPAANNLHKFLGSWCTLGEGNMWKKRGRRAESALRYAQPAAWFGWLWRDQVANATGEIAWLGNFNNLSAVLSWHSSQPFLFIIIIFAFRSLRIRLPSARLRRQLHFV